MYAPGGVLLPDGGSWHGDETTRSGSRDDQAAALGALAGAVPRTSGTPRVQTSLSTPCVAIFARQLGHEQLDLRVQIVDVADVDGDGGRTIQPEQPSSTSGNRQRAIDGSEMAARGSGPHRLQQGVEAGQLQLDELFGGFPDGVAQSALDGVERAGVRPPAELLCDLLVACAG